MLEYKRLQSTDVIRYNTEEQSLSASEVFNSIFSFGAIVDDDFWKDFFEHYEFFYIDETESVYLIVRNARLRMRKFYYLPTLYVKFDLTKVMNGQLEPQHLRYLQKLDFYTNLKNEEPEDAYKFESEIRFMPAYHSHIDAMGCACYGRWATNIGDAVANGAYQTIESIQAFLNDYNGRSPFYRIDPYSFDGSNTAMYKFAKLHNWDTNKYIVLNKFFEYTVGKDWFVDFCQHSNRNYELASQIWFFLESADNDSFEDSIGKDVALFEIIKNYDDTCPYDNYIYYMNGSDSTQYDEWFKFDLWFKGLTGVGFTKDITSWVNHLLGLEVSRGDLAMLSYGMGSNLAVINDLASIVAETDALYKRHNSFNLVMQRIIQRCLLQNNRTTDFYSYVPLFLMIGAFKNPSLMYKKYLEWLQVKSSNTDTQKISMVREIERENRTLYWYEDFRDLPIYTNSCTLDFRAKCAIISNDNTVDYTVDEYWENLLSHQLFQQMNYVAENYNQGSALKDGDYVDLFDAYRGLTNLQELTAEVSLTEEEMFHEILLRSLYQHDMNIDSTLYFKLCDILIAKNHDSNEVTSSMLPYTNRGEEYDENTRENAIKYLYELIPDFPRKASEIKDYKYRLYEPIIFEAYNLRKQELNKHIKEINNAINNSVRSIQQTELFS